MAALHTFVVSYLSHTEDAAVRIDVLVVVMSTGSYASVVGVMTHTKGVLGVAWLLYLEPEHSLGVHILWYWWTVVLYFAAPCKAHQSSTTDYEPEGYDNKLEKQKTTWSKDNMIYKETGH
eukprot:1942890-Amphidinium_carterae.1